MEKEMERRKFIKSAAIGSAGTLVTGNIIAGENKVENIVKITVLKKTFNSDWDKQFRNGQGEICNVFSEGQEFLVKSPWSVPEGFCHWAWADIRTYLHIVNAGTFEKFVACCTDGFRPVFFKIERVEA